MKERNFDEMIAYFNRRVSEMDIAQDYKMELLGMVTALGYKHEKTAQPEIIRCRDCKEYSANYKRCRWWNHETNEAGWCYGAERRTDV